MATKKKKRPIRPFENAVLVSVVACGYTGHVTSEEIKKEVSKHFGADIASVTGGKKLVPDHLMRPMASCARNIRTWLRNNAIPWSVNKSKRDDKRKEDGRWLLFNKQLPEFRQIILQNKEMKEEGERILKESWLGMIAERCNTLGTLFHEEEYPAIEWVLDRFSLDVDIVPVYKIDHIENDLRLRLPREWADHQIETARQLENKRVSNAIGAAAAEVIDAVENTIKKLTEYDPRKGVKKCSKCQAKPTKKADCKKCQGTGEVKDGRVGNIFRDKTLFTNIPILTERVRNLHEMLGDDALRASVDALVDVEKFLKTTDGKDIRNNKAKRTQVAEQLDKVREAVQPATERFSQMMTPLT